MSQFALGIDLGTTNSVVAVADGTEIRVLHDEEGRRLLPSCVSFHPDGSVLVGYDARQRRLMDATNTIYSVKRLIGRPFQSEEVARARERVAFALEAGAGGGVQIRARKGVFSLPEISAMVLRKLRTIADASLGTSCTKAVITVPANFNDLQRSATQAAGKVSGLDVLRILNEPTAATLAYGYGRTKPETVAVYDFGGGTFDVTVLDLDKDVFEVVSTAGDTFLGGDDIDLAIAERMVESCLKQHRLDPRQDMQAFERLRAAAEWTKCQLSVEQTCEAVIEELFLVAGQPVNFTFSMTRDDLDTLARPLIQKSLGVVEDALRSAGRRPKEMDNIVLVGGSTRMPLVRTMVREFFEKEPRVDIDPDLVVAQGAAIHAYTLLGQSQPQKKVLLKVALKRVTAVDMKPPSKRLEERLPQQPAFAPERKPVPGPGRAVATKGAAVRVAGTVPGPGSSPRLSDPSVIKVTGGLDKNAIANALFGGMTGENSVVAMRPAAGVGALRADVDPFADPSAGAVRKNTADGFSTSASMAGMRAELNDPFDAAPRAEGRMPKATMALDPDAIEFEAEPTAMFQAPPENARPGKMPKATMALDGDDLDSLELDAEEEATSFAVPQSALQAHRKASAAAFAATSYAMESAAAPEESSFSGVSDWSLPGSVFFKRRTH